MKSVLSYLAPFIICLPLLWLGMDQHSVLAFQREAIQSGEIWRLLTGHIVHINPMHGIINLLCWPLLLWLVKPNIHPFRLLTISLLIMLSISGALYLLKPELQWYVGLSGLLHGLAAFIFIRQRHYLLFVILIFKLVYEYFIGPVGASLGTDIPVVLEAHLYGVIAGVGGWLFLGRKKQAQNNNQLIINTKQSLPGIPLDKP